MPGWYRNEVVFADSLCYRKVLDCRVISSKTIISNGEFIAMIADKLALEQRTA